MKITVGIPAYNAQDTLGRALDSALGQTWQGPVEILVVDDGSTDRTEGLVAGYARKHDSIRYEKLPQNRGRAAARNAVVELSRGDVLAWLDADDAWHPDKVAQQMEKLDRLLAQGGDAGKIIVTCPYRRARLNGDSRHDVVPPRCYGVMEILELASRRLPALQLQTMLGRCEAWRLTGGFDTSLEWAEDYEFLIRWGDAGGMVYSLDAADPLVTYNFTLAGRDPELILRSQDYIAEKHRELFAKHGVDWRRERAFRRFGYVFYAYKGNGQYREAWEQALTAASDYPDDLRERLLERIVREAVKADKGARSSRSNTGFSTVKPFRPIKRLVKSLYGKS